MAEPRITFAVLLVLRQFLAVAVGAELYGMQVMRASGLSSGTLYPLLLRLESADWLTSRLEEPGPQCDGRPLRRYYRLTEAGTAVAHEVLDGASARLFIPAGPRLTSSSGTIDHSRSCSVITGQPASLVSTMRPCPPCLMTSPAFTPSTCPRPAGRP